MTPEERLAEAQKQVRLALEEVGYRTKAGGAIQVADDAVGTALVLTEAVQAEGADEEVQG